MRAENFEHMGAVKTPQEASTIDQNIELLNSRIDDTTSLLDKLQSKLSSVLKMAYPEPSSDEKKGEPGACNLANAIGQLHYQLDDLNKRFRSVLDRIDL